MTTSCNRRVWRAFLLLTIAALLCFVLVVKAAPPAEQIDQSNLPEWEGGWTHINPTAEGRAAMWQTFTPSRPNLTAVEIDILTISPGRGDDTLTVEIARDGDILATANCYVEDGFEGLLRFEFPQIVLLVPEVIYELMVHDTGTVRFGWKYASNTYERGSRYVFEQERSGTDWFFQTYSEIEPTETKYSGGSGTTDDPYQITTAEDLISLGETPEDYDKHFELMANLDLSGYSYNTALIAPDDDPCDLTFQGMSFSGTLDGSGHMISNLTISGEHYLGLFGRLEYGAEIKDLGVVDINITGSDYIAGLVGFSQGNITNSYCTGTVNGNRFVGGLTGRNWGNIYASYNTAAVTANNNVGGLAAGNYGSIADSYNTGAVTANLDAGGLVGANSGIISTSYSTGKVNAENRVGGLVGYNQPDIGVVSGFWDVETSGLTDSDGAIGKTTDEMQTATTFTEAGWDFVGETKNGSNEIWKMWDGYGYPRLTWESGPNTPLVFLDINDPDFTGQMSRYEVTNAQYCDFLNAALVSGNIMIDGNDIYGASGSNSGEDYVGQRYYRGDGSGWTGAGATNGGASRIHYSTGAFSVDDGFENHPVTYVSWYGAMAFANYYGFYLPTEDQWQAVADYDGTYIYGCGQTIDPGIANYRNSEYPDGTTSVGSFGRYGYGMNDMAGNVWEWVNSGSGDSRIFRGGGWYSYDYDCAVSIRGDGIPYANYTDIGFRVCH